MDPVFLARVEKVLVALIHAKNCMADYFGGFANPERGAARVLNGRLRHATGKYCIFVFYQDQVLPKDFDYLFDALEYCGINAILVANALPPGSEELLANRCHTLMVRKNFGYDFGGFQAGIRFAQALSPERLLLLNDSVHFLRRGLIEYIARLCGDAPYIGATESYQISHHVQSYATSFSREVLESQAFCSFWAKYRPMNEKRYTVFNGELALPAHLRKSGMTPDVIFSMARLRTILETQPDKQLEMSWDLLPESVKVRAESIPFGLQSTSSVVPTKDARIDAIMAAIEPSNQVAIAGFLFAKYLNMPFMKKDLVFHLFYHLGEIARKMKDAGIDADIAEMVSWYEARGNADGATKWQQFCYRHMFA